MVERTGKTPDTCSHPSSSTPSGVHQPITPETDIKGEKGAYFLHASVSLTDGEAKSWDIRSQCKSKIMLQVCGAARTHRQQPAELMDEVRSDVDRGSQALGPTYDPEPMVSVIR